MQSRADWKRGRWNINAETSAIHRGLRGWQRSTGDSVSYWRWDLGASQMHPVYDEGTGVGRQFVGPWQIPVLHASHGDGANAQPRDSGLYLMDTLSVTAEFAQLSKVGLALADIRHGAYQRDRIGYDGVLFTVSSMRILGQIRRRDIVISMTCEQIRDDELVTDPQFSGYATDPSELQQGWYPAAGDDEE